AGHHGAARHAASPLRGADPGGSVPPHSGNDSASRRAARVRRRETRGPPDAPEAPGRCPRRPRSDVERRGIEGAHPAMKIAHVLTVVAALVLTASPALAFDPEQTFRKGAFVLSLDGGGGAQNNLEKHERQTHLDLWWIQGRASVLPFGTSG